MPAAQTKIRAPVERVRRAVVEAVEFKFAERVEGRKTRVNLRPVVVAPPRRDSLVSDRVREIFADALREANGADEQAIAAALVRIVKVRLKGFSGHGRRKLLARRESSGQRER